ncbi:MAG TPA: ABC transporter ATP-binding protein [Gemmatimonadaceae bacterium]|nr:ABC transporter ATP-binding protein [Gemmatimonadaceae bacterium]
MMSSPTTPAIRLTDIHKSFGPVRANRGASLEVIRGEIHALVGENGAGKSTLMRVLSGMYAPDSGRMEVSDNGGALRDVTGWNTAEAIAAGVGMVHQHFMLVPTLTVAENLMLGAELTKDGALRVLDRARAVQAVDELSRRTGLRVNAEQRVAELSVGEAQRVEILKALYRGARTLILDEPTAVLSPPEVSELWQVLRQMRERGETIVLITHKLDEVMSISDNVTVMRHGRTISRLRTSDTTPQQIAREMVGRDVVLAADMHREAAMAGETWAASPSTSVTAAPENGSLGSGLALPALEVRGLVVANARRPSAVDAVSFSLAPGEVLGVAGVEGNGQTELIEAIAGLRRARSGSILLDHLDITDATVRARGDAGLSHIPEDRHARGLVLDYSIADNLILGQQHRFTRGGFLNSLLDRERIGENARRQIAAFDIRPNDAALPARALSGGNQQKIVVAREMGRDFRVLLAAQPTRGVDVGAIEFIHAQLRAARGAGKAILLLSADLAEILALSDRIAVMYGGRFVVVLPRAQASEDVLGPYMTGAEQAA